MTMSISKELDPLDILLKLLSSGRFDYSDEKYCQEQISSFLTGFKVNHIKEFCLGRNGVCDFYFPRSQLVLEVKAGKAWSKMEVYRQCEKYLQHKDVKGLLLATGKIQGMPASINGKPVKVLQLGIGFLQ
ncbi:hypothetical protein [Teredinibacter purpureus]|uniref:hypothetical protein n=1 Tax=Teredinibacter purpureus TaxID=2731756 RepID=UPI0005F777C8|nr:hypothetical protein [Teredinibacter purpureus]